MRIENPKVEGRVKVEDLDKLCAKRALTCFVNAEGHNLKLMCLRLSSDQKHMSRSSEGVMRSQAPFFQSWTGRRCLRMSRTLSGDS